MIVSDNKPLRYFVWSVATRRYVPPGRVAAYVATPSRAYAVTSSVTSGEKLPPSVWYATADDVLDAGYIEVENRAAVLAALRANGAGGEAWVDSTAQITEADYQTLRNRHDS